MEGMTDMTIWDKLIKLAAAGMGAVAGWYGGWTTPMYVLLAFMGVDYLCGLIVAIMGKSHKTDGGGLDSKVGFSGLFKKVLMLLLVLIGAQLDKAFGTNTSVVRDMVCWFYIANEGLSILENMALAGVPFPAAMKKLLEQTKDKHDNHDGAHTI